MINAPNKCRWVAVTVTAIWVMLGAAIATPAQTFKVLADFNHEDGANTRSSLVQGGDGNLYGTTLYGGTNSSGTVFKASPAGVLTTLYNFCSQPSCTDGAFPNPSLVLNTDGNFYGTVESGGYLGPSTCSPWKAWPRNTNTISKLRDRGSRSRCHRRACP